MTVGRFQVMAVLQAARAYSLGLPMESAHSWGLNRATFIAAAKRRFKAGSGSGSSASGGHSKIDDTYSLGDDMAYKVKKGGVLLFTFGGKVQTEDEYDKRVKARFGKSYPAAWKEALAYVRTFDNEVLLSREGFFAEVYRPVRDEWSGHWSSRADADA